MTEDAKAGRRITRVRRKFGQPQRDERVAIAYGFCIRASSALTLSTFGLFAIPVGLALAGKDGNVAIAYGILSLVSGVSAPALGTLIDRFGNRVVQRAGAALLVLGLVLSGLATTTWHYYVAMGVICGIGVTAFTQISINILITSYVMSNRLLAFGIVTAGAGIGALIAVPLSERVIALGGWRVAYLAYAVLVALIWLPYDLWLGRRGQPTGPSTNPSPASPASSAVQEVALEVGECRPPEPAGSQEAPAGPDGPSRSRRRLSRIEAQLVTAGFFSGYQRTLIISFFIPWAVSRDYTTLVAAQAFGVAEGGRAVGGVALAVLGGGLGAKITYMACTSVAATGIGGMLVFGQGGTVALFVVAIVYGLASGGIHPASSSLQSTVYAKSRLGLLFGVSSACFGVGGAAAIACSGVLIPDLGGLDAVMGLIAISLLIMPFLVIGVPDVARSGSKHRRRVRVAL